MRYQSYSSVLVAILWLGLGTSACGTTAPTVKIEWVNFLVLHDIHYIAQVSDSPALPSVLQGPLFATVQFQVADTVHDPAYRIKNGDAAYLKAGTPVYQVIGYAPAFRLAALFHNTLTLFEAETNPHANIGTDLLDIAGKVTAIRIVNGDGLGTGTITDTTRITAMVQMVLSAPVVYSDHVSQGVYYRITFHLKDGTAVVRSLWVNERNLAGIQVPEPFITAVTQAITPSPVSTP